MCVCVYQVISDGRKWVDSLPREGLHPDKRFDLIIQDACAGMKFVTAMLYMVAVAISIGHERVIHDACAGHPCSLVIEESDKHTTRSLSHTHTHTYTQYAGHPCSLVTEEGYARLRDRALADGGKLLQNIFSASPRVVRTMQAVCVSLI